MSRTTRSNYIKHTPQNGISPSAGCLFLSEGKIAFGVYLFVIYVYLEVQMRASGVAGAAGVGNQIALRHDIAH